ncbi:MAG: NAD(P)/FAD-dependent oxidoreductase, partial [Rhodospirillales bacterium]|nr:NAD(P)/FAD-dependent oxidoreductase [Rhodospirillales bacterium]
TIFANNAARRLTAELRAGKARLTMLTASEKHVYQPGWLYVALGRMTPDELEREQASLLEPGIALHVDPVTEFRLAERRVVTASGRTHEYDMLVIATGSRPVPEDIPGLKENAVHCYSAEDALRFHDRLAAFTGGRILVTVGLPHKCPMIPLEITFAVHDYVRDRGLLEKTEIYYTYPIGRSHGLENVAKWASPEFDRLGIRQETFFNLREVDGAAGVARSEEGSEVKYDLLVTVPPHRGAPAIEANKLGADGWIPTDRTSLHMRGEHGANVIVLGDTTDLPISKAGSTAHYEAEVAAENVASLIKTGRAAREYDGKVFCFIEAGKDRATYAMFDYRNPPRPQAPSAAMHAFKMAYNKLYWASARGLL